MKKLIIFCLALVALSSCSIKDDTPNYGLVILPVESVEIPNSFNLGGEYPITVSYLKPSTCNAFKEFYYLEHNNEITVAVIDYEFHGSNCQILENELLEATFNFKVTSNGSYIFKFWQGEDVNGEDQYLIIEVPVIN
ncbi:hypothetical protein [Yeosuana sp.]|uniref:hypothetical protein n=1 Tax=Yeosuana sp. TaxID=2529388 RepID=UPI004054AE81